MWDPKTKNFKLPFNGKAKVASAKNIDPRRPGDTSNLARAACDVVASKEAATLEQVVNRQTLLLEQALSLKQNPRSTIKVEPRVTWPKLGDESVGKEVLEFYDSIEGIFALANNGQGMSAHEQLVALKNCLHGSRKVIYDNVLKRAKNLEGKVEDWQGVYDAIKRRLLKFCETAMEKQLRVRKEWENLWKNKGMSALQFEAKWEEGLRDKEECGLEMSELEKFLAYIEKMGPSLGEEIRKDRRPRPDNAGGATTRPPRTWEEAHEVLVELENLRAGTRAATQSRAGGQRTGGQRL